MKTPVSKNKLNKFYRFTGLVIGIPSFIRVEFVLYHWTWIYVDFGVFSVIFLLVHLCGLRWADHCCVLLPKGFKKITGLGVFRLSAAIPTSSNIVLFNSFFFIKLTVNTVFGVFSGIFLVLGWSERDSHAAILVSSSLIFTRTHLNLLPNYFSWVLREYSYFFQGVF